MTILNCMLGENFVNLQFVCLLHNLISSCFPNYNTSRNDIHCYYVNSKPTIPIEVDGHIKETFSSYKVTIIASSRA